MLGLRLDEPLGLAGLRSAIDPESLARMVAGGMALTLPAADGGEMLTLSARGRFLGGGVTAELLA